MTPIEIDLGLLADSDLFDSQLVLNLLQRHSFGLGHHRLHPNQLQDHHAGKERENVARREGSDHLGKERGERSSENPVREAAQRLAFGAMTVGKNLGDEDPDHRSLADGMRRDESKNTRRHDGVMLRKESLSDQAERSNVAERADIEQSSAA